MNACTGVYKGVRAVRQELVAGRGCLRCYGIWNEGGKEGNVLFNDAYGKRPFR